jgi:hypothetical protein
MIEGRMMKVRCDGDSEGLEMKTRIRRALGVLEGTYEHGSRTTRRLGVDRRISPKFRPVRIGYAKRAPWVISNT